MRPPGFISDLCIALCHRWEADRLFVILTAYLDESGTHDGSSHTVMGGMMGNVKQWQAFEEKFRKAKKEFGFQIFHTKKFKHKSGDFKGWTNEKCLALVDRLSDITQTAFMESVTISVNNADYVRDYRTADVPRKVRVPSKYGLCFQECLLHFLVEADKRQFRGKFPSLDVVCESGPKNSGDAARIFNEYKAWADNSNLPILKTITFANKDESDPLMISDFLAHTRYWRESEGVNVSPDEIVPIDQSNCRGITYLSYKPEGLVGRKKQLIEEFEMRRSLAREKRPV